MTGPPKHIVDLAIEVSTYSPCRSKRGVVIFKGESIISHGYNNKPPGFICDASNECKATCRIQAVHAEQKALLLAGPTAWKCDALHIKTIEGKPVPSGEPSCVQCSKLLLSAGISGVWLLHEAGWHRYSAVEFHTISLNL